MMPQEIKYYICRRDHLRIIYQYIIILLPNVLIDEHIEYHLRVKKVRYV